MYNRELNIKKIAAWIIKSLYGSLSVHEQKQLKKWEKASESHRRLLEKLQEESYLQEQYDRYKATKPTEDWQQLQERIKQTGSKRYTWKKIVRYAAAIILIIGSGYAASRLWENREKEKPLLANLLPPGNVKAVLELDNGQQIPLEKEIEVRKLDEKGIRQDSNGLIYQDSLPMPVEYHTLRIPLGGEYKLMLGDGSVIWLNAGSCLHYPNRFVGSERKVRIEGEAYFKVAADRKHPFIVSTGEVEIYVTGTEFNVKSYPEENQIATTLVTGEVKLQNGQGTVQLLPGEQGIFTKGEQGFIKQQVDVLYYVSWKDGIFEFDDKPLGEIVPQLERWYNVKICFETSTVKDIRFTGAVKREKDMVFILDMIRNTKAVDYRIEGQSVWLKKK